MNPFAERAIERAQALVPPAIRETLMVRAFGLLRIPLLAYVRPAVLTMDGERCVVRIPLSRRTKNHLGSMYFGALAVGADVAGGLLAFHWMRKRRARLNFIFKDVHGEFLARPHGDVEFVCEDGNAMRDLVDRAMSSHERVESKVNVVAWVRRGLGARTNGHEPAAGEDRVVARFTLTISLKERQARPAR